MYIIVAVLFFILGTIVGHIIMEDVVESGDSKKVEVLEPFNPDFKEEARKLLETGELEKRIGILSILTQDLKDSVDKYRDFISSSK